MYLEEGAIFPELGDRWFIDNGEMQYVTCNNHNLMLLEAGT